MKKVEMSHSELYELHIHYFFFHTSKSKRND